MLWIKEVEMVDSVDDLNTSQSIGGRRLPNFEMLDAKIASALEEDHHEPLLQEECQSGGGRGPNGRPIAPWKTDCVHDLRILSGNWSTCKLVLDYSDLCRITSRWRRFFRF